MKQKNISYGKQWISQGDIDAVTEVLRSDFLTQGPKVREFEKAICSYTGAKYCVVVSNGTAALHIAVAALEVEAGGEGITTPITFAASANCMLYNEIIPRYADINSRTYNIEPQNIHGLINSKTKLLLPVHFAGQSADMKKIKTIADDNNLHVIEDAAHAIGSQYADGSYVGNCKYSDMTTFSFHPVKTITTGEGGAITTNSKVFYDRLCLLRSHGITKDEDQLSQKPGPWYYEMKSLGYNYRLSDFQAALGISQLSRLNSFKQRRQEIVYKYNKAFSKIDCVEIPYEQECLSSCFHLYVIKVDFRKIGTTRSDFMGSLSKVNIGTQVHYIPVNLLPYHAEMNQDCCPEAISYYDQCISLPLYPQLTVEDQDYVISKIFQYLQSESSE